MTRPRSTLWRSLAPTDSMPELNLVENPAWDLNVADYATHPRVQYFVDFFTGTRAGSLPDLARAHGGSSSRSFGSGWPSTRSPVISSTSP